VYRAHRISAVSSDGLPGKESGWLTAVRRQTAPRLNGRPLRYLVSMRETAIVLREARGGALVLSVSAIVLAVLGLTPGLQGIPEVPLLTAAILVSVGVCGVCGYRAARRAGRALAGATAGALAGAAGGGVGGLCYVFFGKSALNVPAGIVLGLMGGAAIGAAGALVRQRAARPAR